MITLHDCSSTHWNADSFVATVTRCCDGPSSSHGQKILLLRGDEEVIPTGFRAYLTFHNAFADRPRSVKEHLLTVSSRLDYLEDGDLLHISPRDGRVSVLYRRNSASNAILLTEWCNCKCIMCPQPPRNRENSDWTDLWLKAIPLMSPDTPELAVTGGEPTLVPEGLLKIIAACRHHLPRTPLSVLSNGRMFNYMSLCREVASLGHPQLEICIPLYCDLAYLHDYIVQAEGAFDQTIRGAMNLKRCGLQIELRVVVMRQNATRLLELARFIARNLSFASHVAIMGLEAMGHAAKHWDALWLDPADYQELLVSAVEELLSHHIPVSIYNHQLCVLEPRLWPFARKAISDWKNEYLPLCGGCVCRDECGGFFASCRRRHSRLIHALS